MANAALKALEDQRAQDEELVAIVENDACGVDAVQYLTGCTFGKGNLIFRDYGKSVYSFYHRATGKAVRVAAKPRSPSEQTREEMIQRWLSASEADLVTVQEVSIPTPEYARIRASVTCAYCGERVMETRARIREGKVACIPCAERKA